VGDADERLRCWAAGVQVQLELDAARENARHMLELLQSGADPKSSMTFETEAANYRLHIGAVELGIRDAEACGDKPIDPSWVGEFKRFAVGIGNVPSYEEDAHSQVQELDSVADWLQRDTAGIPRPGDEATGTAHDAHPSGPKETVYRVPIIDSETGEVKGHADIHAPDADSARSQLEQQIEYAGQTDPDAPDEEPGEPYLLTFTRDEEDRVKKLFEQTLGVMNEAVDENVEEQAATSIVEDIEILSREIRVPPDTIRAVLRDMGALQ
jgi:hypothetical protein